MIRKQILLLVVFLSSVATSHSLVVPRPFGAEVRGGGGAAGKSQIARTASESSGEGTATIPNEVFNLVKSIVGAGVLSLPYGVAAFGNAPSALAPGIGLIAVTGLISAYTFGLIGRICQKTKTSSYADAWDVAVGKSTSALIAFSCFFDCFMGNLSYSMILADTVANLAASAGYALTRTQALLGVTSVVLFPLCMLKNLSSLAPFSLVRIKQHHCMWFCCNAHFAHTFLL